jgi:peptidoglycan/LPS O-acetylase OafA/YrhL
MTPVMAQISPPAAGLSGAYMPGLDGVRAYAVAAVVFFHCAVPGFSGGWVGVDVFFGLSGFLITGILVAEIDRTRSVALGRFWRRRMRRLAPALVLLLGFCVLLAVAAGLEMRTSGIWGAVTYTTNWVNILVPGQGYWDAFAEPDPLEHLWSLAIEEQFYVLWPLVVLLVGRRSGRRGVTRVAVALAVASLAMQFVGVASGWSIDRLYQGTDTRAFPFLVGAAVASHGIPAMGRRVAHAVAVVSIAVLGAATIGLDGSQTSIFLGPLQAVSLAGIALVAVAARSSARIVCHPAVRSIGRWSYGIYLVHWPLVVVLPDDMSTLMRVTVVSALSVILAALSHRLVESPIRSDGLTGWRLVTAPVAALGTLAAALVLAVPVVPAAIAERSEAALDWDALGATSDPFPGSETTPRESTDDADAPGAAGTMSATLAGPISSSTVPAAPRPSDATVEATVPVTSAPPPTAPLPRVADPESILVIGDSTAAVLAHGLTTTRRFQVVDGGVWGCPIVTTAAVRPTPDNERSTEYCPDLERQISAIELLDPDVVVLMASPPHQWDHRYLSVEGWHAPGDLHWRQAHDDHLARIVDAHPGLPVVVVDAPPARAPSKDALEGPDRLAIWNAQISRWADRHVQVGVLDYAHHLPDPGSDLDSRQRPDGVHLTDAVIEQLVADHLADDLVALVRSLQVEIHAAGGR